MNMKKKEEAITEINNAFLELCDILPKTSSLDRLSVLRKVCDTIVDNYYAYTEVKYPRWSKDFRHDFIMKVMEHLYKDDFRMPVKYAMSYDKSMETRKYPGFAYLNAHIEVHFRAEADGSRMTQEGLPDSAVRYYYKLKNAVERFEDESERTADRADWLAIAERENIPKTAAEAIYTYLLCTPVSMDETIDEDEEITRGDMVADDDAQTAYDTVFDAPLESPAEIYLLLERILDVSPLIKIKKGIDAYMGVMSRNQIDLEVLSIGDYENIQPRKGKDRRGSPTHLNDIIGKCPEDVRIRVVFPNDYDGHYRPSVKIVYDSFLNCMVHLNDGDVALLFNITSAWMSKIKKTGDEVMELYREKRRHTI